MENPRQASKNEFCQRILIKYTGYIPTIIIPDKDIEITKRKFLLSKTENFGSCIISIRKYIKIKPSEALDNKIVDMKENIGDFYQEYKLNKKPEDAYLYIYVIKEKNFRLIFKDIYTFKN